MRKIAHISFGYIKHYKRQTAALFTGIVLAAALLTGMGGLLASGRNTALENARRLYGDWHYSIAGGTEQAADLDRGKADSGFTVEKSGRLYFRCMTEVPVETEFVYADSGYLEMMHCTAESGYYPKSDNEIAADKESLMLLGASCKTGEKVQIGDESFTVCGIMKSLPEKLNGHKGTSARVYVSDTFGYSENSGSLYIKFKENGNVYGQLLAFCKKYGVDHSDIKRNDEIDSMAGGDIPVSVLKTVKEGISHKELGLPYIWGSLNESGTFSEKVILAGIGLFGAFMIYSLFRVSVIKRIPQYSVMETIGMTDGYKTAMLLTELFCVGVLAYPLGCVLGNTAAWLICRRAGQLFVPHDISKHTGVGDEAARTAVSAVSDAGKYIVNRRVVLYGAVGLAAVLVFISLMLVHRMRKSTLREMIAGTPVKDKKRRIFSRKRSDLTGMITKRFMFTGKRRTAADLLSLSLGGILFLGAVYVAENTKLNNELTLKADDGLGSDINVCIQSDDLSDSIPADTAEKMKGISGISEVHPVSYTLGEIELNDGIFKWTEYYPELDESEDNAPDPDIMEKYNGRAVQTGDDDYAVKVNIYGYDDEMLGQMNEYLLSGSIDPERMRRENTVIFKTITDGQGNCDGIDLDAGDSFDLKTVRSSDVPAEALRFLGSDEWYSSCCFTIDAVAVRPLAKVDDLIGEAGNSTIDIIMTTEQMEKNFGISDMRTVSISIDSPEVSESVSEELYSLTGDVNRCVVKNYTEQIKQQNEHIGRKMVFFYGIAAVILGVSLMHIMNSMQYMVSARRREFGILRAMGITDSGFSKMLAVHGVRYGLCCAAVTAVVYFFVQRMLYFFMLRVYLYVRPEAFVSFRAFAAVITATVLLCTAVSVTSGRSVLKTEITDEIRE